MNYFSHYYVLNTHDDSYLALGSILPDMLRNAKTEFSEMSRKTIQNQSFDSLTAGIISHIEVDKKFHNSDFFLKYSKHFASVIRDQQKIEMKRYTQFYAHILLELVLDYWLIQKNRNLLIQFYDKLENVDRVLIDTYFAKHFPSQDFELFWETFTKFKTRQFLKDYDNLDKVIEFSFYVYEKATKQLINREEKNYYKSIITIEMLPVIEKNGRNLFKSITTLE